MLRYNACLEFCTADICYDFKLQIIRGLPLWVGWFFQADLQPLLFESNAVNSMSDKPQKRRLPRRKGEPLSAWEKLLREYSIQKNGLRRFCSKVFTDA
jgi:hypothetical protein